jgi:hypothetical protein
MPIERIARGPHRIGSVTCPACQYTMHKASGFESGGKPATYAEQWDPEKVRILVCGRCEIAIARFQDGALLAFDEATEAQLPHAAREALRESRNELRIKKATGALKIPPRDS